MVICAYGCGYRNNQLNGLISIGNQWNSIRNHAHILGSCFRWWTNTLTISCGSFFGTQKRNGRRIHLGKLNLKCASIFINGIWNLRPWWTISFKPLCIFRKLNCGNILHQCGNSRHCRFGKSALIGHSCELKFSGLNIGCLGLCGRNATNHDSHRQNIKHTGIRRAFRVNRCHILRGYGIRKTSNKRLWNGRNARTRFNIKRECTFKSCGAINIAYWTNGSQTYISGKPNYGINIRWLTEFSSR